MRGTQVSVFRGIVAEGKAPSIRFKSDERLGIRGERFKERPRLPFTPGRDEIVPSFNFSHSFAGPFAIHRSVLSPFSSSPAPALFVSTSSPVPLPSTSSSISPRGPRHALTQKAGNSCSIHRLSPPRGRLFPLVFSLVRVHVLSNPLPPFSSFLKRKPPSSFACCFLVDTYWTNDCDLS